MAISRIDSSTAHGTPVSDRTPTEPAGTAENDYVVCLASVTNVDGAWTDPADFTEITNKTETAGNSDAHIYLGFKKRGATAGNGYQFSYGGTAGGMRVTLLTLRGCDLTNFLDTAYVEGSHYTTSADDPNGTCQPIDTVTNGAWVLAIEQASQTITGPTGVPSGYTVAADYMTEINRLHYIASKLVASAGTETPGAFTHTDSVGTADGRLFTLAIRPAGGSKLAVFRRIRG